MATRIKEGMTGAEVAQIIDDGFDNLDEIKQDVELNRSHIEDIQNAPFVFELLGVGTTKEEVNINYIGKTEGIVGNKEFQRTIPSASALNAGVMTAADKVKLDSACTVFMLDIDDFLIGETYEGELTSEEVNLLVDTYKKGGIITLYINSQSTLYSNSVEVTDDKITATFSRSGYNDDLDLITTNIVLEIALDFKYTIIGDAYIIQYSGSGTKFLSDDGSYKEVSVDTSKFATKEDLTTKADLTGAQFTGNLDARQMSLSHPTDGAMFSMLPNSRDITFRTLNAGIQSMTFQVQSEIPLKITEAGIWENGVLLENKYAQFTDIPTVPTKTSQLQNDSDFVTLENLNEKLATKQDNLVSGTNIKTINGKSLLGSGDIVIEQSGSDVIVDVTNICKTLFTNHNISQENYNYLKEYITAGKNLLITGKEGGMLFQGIHNGSETIISQFTPSYRDEALIIRYATIDQDLSVLTKTATFSEDSAIPKAVQLSQYESRDKYAQIFKQDSINIAISKLEGGIKSLTINAYGTTQNRPSSLITTGYKYFDTTLNKPIWWNGTKWVDYNGNSADAKTSGTTSERPSDVNVGFQYFDAEINSPVYWNGEEWVQPATDTGVKVVKITQTDYDAIETKDPNTLYAIISDSTIQ